VQTFLFWTIVGDRTAVIGIAIIKNHLQILISAESLLWRAKLLAPHAVNGFYI